MVGRPISHSTVRLVFAMLALAASGSAGCQFNPNGQTGGDADGAVPPPDPDAMQPPDDAIADARERDGREPDGREPDAGEPPDAAVLPPDGVLVDRLLLTRYFIDESNSGSDIPEMQDSASPPLPLTINYDGTAAFVEEGGNRGLRWNELTEQSDGRASAPVGANSKIRQRLNGSTQATIELVVDIDQFLPGSRLSHIGENDDRGVFTLRLEQPESVRFFLNNDNLENNAWNVVMVGRGRTVLHLVLDTSRTNAVERVRLYVDGVEQSNLDLVTPTRNEAIEILSDNHFYVLGNTNNGDRGILGTIFYAAMYSTALDAGEVEHNAGILSANDDTPTN